MGLSQKINWGVAVIGLWEALAPFILGYSFIAAALANALVIGITIIILAAWAGLTSNLISERTLDWVIAVLGLWLIAAPFVLGYSDLTIAMWNAIIVGVVVAGLEIWAALSVPSPTQVGDFGQQD